MTTINHIESCRNTHLIKSHINKSYCTFKKNYIWINKQKISIAGSLKDVARQINRYRHKTNVVATIARDNKGKEKLILKCFGRNLKINDPNKIFLDIFHNGLLGKGADKLLEIKESQQRINFSYSNKRIIHTFSKGLVLNHSIVKNTGHNLHVVQNDLPVIEQPQPFVEPPNDGHRNGQSWGSYFAEKALAYMYNNPENVAYLIESLYV